MLLKCCTDLMGVTMLTAPTIYSTHMYHYYPAQMSQPFYYYPIGGQHIDQQQYYQQNYSQYQYHHHLDSYHNHHQYYRYDNNMQSPTYYTTSIAQAQYQHMNATAFVRLNDDNKLNRGESKLKTKNNKKSYY